MAALPRQTGGPPALQGLIHPQHLLFLEMYYILFIYSSVEHRHGLKRHQVSVLESEVGNTEFPGPSAGLSVRL